MIQQSIFFRFKNLKFLQLPVLIQNQISKILCCGLEYCESAIQIHRLEVYARDEQGQLVGLSGMGEEIV